MNTLICAGGSGSRVLEAMLHLCAAGLGPPSLRLLMIDPDSSNGSGARVSALVERYLAAHRRFGGKLGAGLRLFGTELDLLEIEGRVEGLKIWSPIKKGQKLRDILNLELLESTPTPPDVVRLLYTEEELVMDLSQGFRGHPSVGAAAMSLVVLQAKEQPWRQLVEKIRGDLARDEGSRIFVTGSVFGGTGAATFFPIARFLRGVAEMNQSRLRIAVGAFSPYFRFEAAAGRVAESTSRQAAKAERFPIATRGAVDFYEHLRSVGVEGSWPFDVFYWVGDDSAVTVPYAPGGPNQKNPAHFVELVLALAALDFFQAPGELSGCCYSGSNSRAVAGETGTVVEWSDLPLLRLERDRLRTELLRFLLVGAAHRGFFGELLASGEIERQPLLVPWYWERFASRGDSLTTAASREALQELDSYFGDQHFPWWTEVLRQGSIRLFNRAALDGDAGVRLDRLSNLLWPDKAAEADPDAIDAFYTEVSAVPKRRGGAGGVASYLALLAHAAERYIANYYKKTGTKE